jgi:hypothetical protein
MDSSPTGLFETATVQQHCIKENFGLTDRDINSAKLIGAVESDHVLPGTRKCPPGANATSSQAPRNESSAPRIMPMHLQSQTVWTCLI